MASSDFQLLNSGYHRIDVNRLLLKGLKKANWKSPCYGITPSRLSCYISCSLYFLYLIHVTCVLRSTNLNFLTLHISVFAAENCQRTYAQASSYLWEPPQKYVIYVQRFSSLLLLPNIQSHKGPSPSTIKKKHDKTSIVLPKRFPTMFTSIYLYFCSSLQQHSNKNIGHRDTGELQWNNLPGLEWKVMM